jgi:hypothetical protein
MVGFDPTYSVTSSGMSVLPNGGSGRRLSKWKCTRYTLGGVWWGWTGAYAGTCPIPGFVCRSLVSVEDAKSHRKYQVGICTRIWERLRSWSIKVPKVGPLRDLETNASSKENKELPSPNTYDVQNNLAGATISCFCSKTNQNY